MTERITPEQIANVRAEYRAVVANTTNGGSGEDFATLAAWLIPALDEIEHLTALVTEQKRRIDWLLDARGGAAYDASVVEGFIRDGDALRNALRDALRFVANVPVDAMREWHAALRGSALPPPPTREEGVTTDEE